MVRALASGRHGDASTASSAGFQHRSMTVHRAGPGYIPGKPVLHRAFSELAVVGECHSEVLQDDWHCGDAGATDGR